MTVTAPTHRDAKAGHCGMCRRGSHVLCASDTCTCSTTTHANRPRSNGGGPPSPRTAQHTPKAKLTQAQARLLTAPVWELVKADPPVPPPKPKRLTVVERARPFLELILEAGSRDWHRIALFPSTMGAAQTVSRLRKAFSRTEWEWKAARVPEVGQSAVYVRWLGKSGTQL